MSRHDLAWAWRLSRVRRLTRQTPFRGDAAFVDVVPAAWQLLTARRARRVLEVRDGQGLVIVDGDLGESAASPGSLRRLVSGVGLAVVATWALPLTAAVGVVLLADRALRLAGLPKGTGPVYGGLLLALWLLVLAVRLLAFAARRGATAAGRRADLVTWIAPTVRVAVSAHAGRDQSWLVADLPAEARRAGMPLTVDVSRMIDSRRLAQSFARSSAWTEVGGGTRVDPALFLTNLAEVSAPSEEVRRQRHQRWLAVAPRVGLLVVAAFLLAGMVSGWLVWQADTEFGRCRSSGCAPVGDLGDSVYWGLAMITGFGGPVPRTWTARGVGIVLELAGLFLTAALIGSVVAAWQAWSTARADSGVDADVEAWERVGLLRRPQAGKRRRALVGRVTRWLGLSRDRSTR